jgi:hypothetical protein
MVRNKTLAGLVMVFFFWGCDSFKVGGNSNPGARPFSPKTMKHLSLLSKKWLGLIRIICSNLDYTAKEYGTMSAAHSTTVQSLIKKYSDLCGLRVSAV